MDKLFKTALADAAYWEDFERLQALIPALKNAGDMKGYGRQRSSKFETPQRLPTSRLCQPVLRQLDFASWHDGAVQSRAFAERVRRP
jgi:hypothetical protein